MIDKEVTLGLSKIIRTVIIGVVLLIILFGSFYTISAGQNGILLTFSKPSDQLSEPGLHFKLPLFQSVVKMSTQTQKYESESSAASSDLQTVTTKIAINYHLDKSGLLSLYKEIGLDYQARVIQPLEQEIVKAVTSKFTAEELITRREEVREQIKTTLHDRLISKGIVVEEISITNFDFSKTFNDAIEAKVTAEQQALAAKNKLEQIKFEAEQTVTSAQAQAEALSLQKSEVTPDLIRLREIEVQKAAVDKWNGILPQVTGGAIPFIGITPRNSS